MIVTQAEVDAIRARYGAMPAEPLEWLDEYGVVGYLGAAEDADSGFARRIPVVVADFGESKDAHARGEFLIRAHADVGTLLRAIAQRDEQARLDHAMLEAQAAQIVRLRSDVVDRQLLVDGYADQIVALRAQRGAA